MTLPTKIYSDKMTRFLVVIASILLFNAADLKAENESPICDLKSPKPVPRILNDAPGYRYLEVIGWESPNIWECQWSFQGGVSSSILEMTRIILSPNDRLVVTVKNGNETVMVYNNNGTSVPGLLFLNSNWNISLTLDSKIKFDRTFEILFSQNYDDIPLVYERGSLSFPLNPAQKFDQPNTFKLQPSAHFSERKIMLRFSSPTTFNVTVDGKSVNTSDPDIYMALNNTVSFSFSGKINTSKPVVIDYWLVTAQCSHEIELTEKSPSAQIQFPDEDYRKNQALTEIKCAQIFKIPKGKFTELSLDPKMITLPNPGDLFTIYDLPAFKSQVAISSWALPYFAAIHTFMDQEKFLMIYDSPYGSPSKEKPLPITLSLTNNATIQLNDDNPSKTFSIQKSNEPNKLIINVYALSNKNLIVIFNQKKIGPNKMKMAFYKTDFITPNVKPFIVLDSFDEFPPAIPIDNTIMRVELWGELEKIDLTFKLMEPTDCYSVSLDSPTFKVQDAKRNCSWFIPADTTNNYTVLSPTFLRLPQGTSLEFHTLNEKSTHEPVVIKGPIDDAFLPDYLTSSSNAYLINFVTNNASVEGVDIFISKKADSFKNRTILNDASSVSYSSINYPGQYPIGYSESVYVFKEHKGQNRSFFITINDFQLTGNHSLIFFNGTYGIINEKDQLNKIPDYFFTERVVITFDTNNSAIFSHSSRGFDLTMTYFSCGGVVDLTDEKNSKTIEFKYNASVNYQYPLCVWKVIADSKATNLSQTVMNFNISRKSNSTNAKIHVYDTISLRNSSIHYALCNETEHLCLNSDPKSNLTGYFKGSIGHAIIIYDFSKSLNTKQDLSMEIVIEKTACAKTGYNLTYCANGERCITDLMACNHQNDCGDWSDEMFCSDGHWIPPIPPSPSDHTGGGGVNVWVVIFVLMPLGAILGILGYIFLPRLLVNIRHGRYSEFRSDLSEVS